MAWFLTFRDESNGRELKSQHETCDDALKQARATRSLHTIISIEGPGGVTLNAAQIEKALASMPS